MALDFDYKSKEEEDKANEYILEYKCKNYTHVEELISIHEFYLKSIHNLLCTGIIDEDNKTCIRFANRFKAGYYYKYKDLRENSRRMAKKWMRLFSKDELWNCILESFFLCVHRFKFKERNFFDYMDIQFVYRLYNAMFLSYKSQYYVLRDCIWLNDENLAEYNPNEDSSLDDYLFFKSPPTDNYINILDIEKDDADDINSFSSFLLGIDCNIFDKLSILQREIIYLKYIKGYSRVEIAEELSVNFSFIKSQFEKIKDILCNYHFISKDAIFSQCINPVSI